MRVLLVSDFLPPVRGGLEFHVAALASALCDAGDEVDVATLTENPRLDDPRVRIHTIRALGSAVLPHESPDRPFHPPLPDPRARAQFARLLADLRPDVVHAHSWLGVSVPHRRDGAAPLVFTAHDYGLVCQLRTLVRPDRSICPGPHLPTCIRCGTHRYAAPVSALLAPGTIAGRRLLRPDAVFAVSSAVRDALAVGGVPSRVMPNFVPDAPVRTPVPDGVLPAGRYVMFAGHAGQDKGLDDLLGIWRDGAPGGAALFAATTRPAGFAAPDGVRLASLTRTQTATAWSGAAVAVVPSRWPEPCPTVVLEAMQAGVPVVAYAVGGIPDLVRDGTDGMLVPMGDTVALRAALTALLTDDARRREMGERARERSARFTATQVVADIRAGYAEVAGASALSAGVAAGTS